MLFEHFHCKLSKTLKIGNICDTHTCTSDSRSTFCICISKCWLTQILAKSELFFPLVNGIAYQGCVDNGVQWSPVALLAGIHQSWVTISDQCMGPECHCTHYICIVINLDMSDSKLLLSISMQLTVDNSNTYKRVKGCF